MTTPTNTQLRGHCQACGRQQAVLTGLLAKHGYDVKNGYFRGTCSGSNHAPMEVSTAYTDEVVASLGEIADNNERIARSYESGDCHPVLVDGPYDVNTCKRTQVPFTSASVYEQRRAIERAVWNLRNEAKHLRQHSTDIKALATRVHGQPLAQVAKPAPAAPILLGELRTLGSGSVASVTAVQRARVYFLTPTGRRGWVGIAAWRKLPLAV